MNITKIQFKDFSEEAKVNKNIMALVDINIDYDFKIHDIKLMRGQKGPYLIFPQNKSRKFIVYPIKDDIRQQILDDILNEYYNNSND